MDISIKEQTNVKRPMQPTKKCYRVRLTHSSITDDILDTKDIWAESKERALLKYIKNNDWFK